jgi:phosphatidylserine/phosphatidylglycerophosphate/cardiolipin synthase-like enzyme
MEMIRGGVSHLSAEPVSFYTGPEMLVVFEQFFQHMEVSFRATQYCIDHTELCNKLVVKMMSGVQGKMLLDSFMFEGPSCARQPARLHELYEAGLEIKTIKPSDKGFACQHTKSWIIDGEVFLTGSVNCTHGGMENNLEHLIVIRDKVVVNKAIETFEEWWKNSRSKVVNNERMEKMIAWKKHKDEKSLSSRNSKGIQRSGST